MSEHIEDYEWDSTITRVYQEVVGEADPDQGTTRKEAFDTAHERIAAMVESGELFIDPNAAIRATLARVDESQGRAADAVLKRLRHGQDALRIEGDPFLDTVVVLGDGNRKPWRHVTAEDLREMDRLRYQNVRQQQVAYDNWRETYDYILPAVALYGTVGKADSAGAFDVDDLDVAS